MGQLPIHQWRIPLLWILVGLNLMIAAAVPWALIGLTPKPYFSQPHLTNPEVFGVLVFLSAELLLLGFVTALFDPRLPVRYISLIGIIVVAGGIFAADLNLLFHVYYPEVARWIEYRYVTVFSASIAFVIMAFIFVLLSHCILWLARSLAGMRITLGDYPGAMPRRQFGMAQGLLWMGLIGAFFGAARAFSAQDWFLESVVFGSLATMAATAIVVPTLCATFRRRVSRLAIAMLVVYVIGLSVAEGVVFFYAFTVPGLFFMTWACLIVTVFNLTIVGVIWFNSWALATMGAGVVVGAKYGHESG